MRVSMRTLPIALTIIGCIVNPMVRLELIAAESPSDSASRFAEEDSDDDGLTNAEEADSGSDPTLKYSDGDGLMDGEDAVPNDDDFAFPRVPESSYAMIDLGPDTYTMDLNNANQALLKVISGTITSCVVWDKGQTLTVPFAFSSVLHQIADDGKVVGKTPESLSGSDNQDLFSWDPSMGTTPTKIVDVPTGTYNESGYSWRGYTAKAQYLSAAGTLFYETGTFTGQVGMTDNGWVESGSGTTNDRSLNPTEERNEYTTNWHYNADGPVDDVIRETTEAGVQGTVLAVVGSGGNAKIIHKELEFLNCKFLEREVGGNYTYDYSGTVKVSLKLGNQTLLSNSVSYFDYNEQSLGYPEGPVPPGVSKIVNDITILPEVTGTDGTMHYEAVYAGGFLTQQARAWIDDGSSGKEKLLYHDAHRTKPVQGVASAINSRGEIILPGNMIWQNGRTFNIGTRLSGNAATDFTVPSVKKINDSGVILAETKKIATSGTALPTNEQKNHAVLLVPVDLAVDANRDGVIKFAGSGTGASFQGKPQDRTEEPKPFRFWVNDDQDQLVLEAIFEGEMIPVQQADSSDDEIKSRRDLEDFTRLYLHVGAFHEEINNGTFKIGLKWKNTSGTSPKIKVYQSADPEGSDLYLKNEQAALNQIDGENAETLGQVEGALPLVLDRDGLWNDYSEQNPKLCLLFEGVETGKGELVLTIQKPDGTSLGEGGSVWLDIVNVRKMYERANGTGTIVAPHESTSTPQTPSVGYELDLNNGQWEYPTVSWSESKEYIVFVHGWNTEYESARALFADTMFKRLWQRGYKGRFAALYWPTLVGLNTYNESEYKAWFYGESLKKYVDDLPETYTKNLVAHSMGNVVGGSALRKGMNVETYAMINAAVPASCYDPDPTLQQSYGNSPDNDLDQSTLALAYKGKLPGSENTKFINFYLATDDALEAWVVNNSYFKPEVFAQVTGGDHAYKYFPGNPYGEKLFLTFIVSPKRNLQQMEESLAYAARSSTKAVGAEGNTQGSISVSINEADYGYQDEHSGFWQFNLQKMKLAYDRLMDEMGMQRNP